MDSFTLSSADEGLADLQPEDSDDEDGVSSGARAQLTTDQKVNTKKLMLYSWKFSPGENFFTFFVPLGEIFILWIFLSLVNGNFYVWVKIYSAQYFCNAKVGGLSEILSIDNFLLAVWYFNYWVYPDFIFFFCFSEA